MKDPNGLCPGCMEEWGDPEKPCPHCGFQEKKYEKPPRWLPLRCILNGKYMLGKVIGEGGFGITYLGWDLNLQVRVAVKEYFPVGLATREAGMSGAYSISALPGIRQENYRQGLEKFMAEAKNLSKFYHLQGIVSVRDFFFENDTAYMVMEYVDGVTLGTYLKKHGGQISEQEALALFHPVMDSLKVVHQAGIIHRDISPDNIMMTKDGRMKLIDFGAARFAGGDTEKSLTIILKHGYAPAEQYQSHGNQGPWTDVYAICATMYRMITGKVPPSAMDRLHEDTLEEFSALGCRVSDRTAYALIDKGMAIRAEDRYPGMEELIAGLYSMNQKKIRRKRKPGKKKNTVWLLWGGGAAAAAAGICVVLLLGGGKSGGGLIPETWTEAGAAGAHSGSGGVSSAEGEAEKAVPAVSAEELAALQAEAGAQEKTLAADGFYFLAVREDGTAAGSGANQAGQLDVGGWSELAGVASGPSHAIGLKSDGTAAAAGDTSKGKCAVDMWKDLTAVAAGDQHSLGLKSDGTVYAAGSNEEGQCSVSSWTGITGIAAGAAHSLGLLADGTVVSAGAAGNAACQTEDWTDIAAVYAKNHVSAGLKTDGTVVVAGDEELAKACSGWKQVVSVALGDGFAAGLLTDGTVRIAGESAAGPVAAAGWEEITAIAASDEALFGRKADGTIVRTSHTYGTVEKEAFSDLSKVVSGGGYLLGLRTDGTVLSWGVSGKDPGLDVVKTWSGMTDIAANGEAALGLRSDGTVETIGEGYEEASSWASVESIAAVGDLAAGLKTDGTVAVAGPGADEAVKATVSGWTDVRSLCAGSLGALAAVRSDGTILSLASSVGTSVEGAVSAAVGPGYAAAVCADGTVEVSGNAPGGSGNVYSWRDVVQTAAGASHTVGLRSDGTVLAAGSNSNGQCEVGGWTDVAYVTAGESVTIGVLTDGTMVMAGKLPGEY